MPYFSYVQFTINKEVCYHSASLILQTESTCFFTTRTGHLSVRSSWQIYSWISEVGTLYEEQRKEKKESEKKMHPPRARVLLACLTLEPSFYRGFWSPHYMPKRYGRPGAPGAQIVINYYWQSRQGTGALKGDFHPANSLCTPLDIFSPLTQLYC